MGTQTTVGETSDAGDGVGQRTDQPGSVDASDTAQETPPDAVSNRIDDDDVFEVLSNQRRRYALHYLMQRPDEAVEMGELSTQVAAWEQGVVPEAVTYDQRKSVHTSLYQYHAPKLDDTGVVEYDSRGGVVELTTEGAALDLYLETVRGREIPWASYFVLLSVFATAVVGATWLGVPPFAGLPGYASAGFVVAGFLVSSLVFAYDSQTAMRFGSAGPPPGVSER